MGLLAEYELVFEHLPLVDVAAAVPEATLTVDVGQPNQGGPPPFDLRADGAPPGTVERALERSAFVDSYATVEATDHRGRYQVLPAATMTEQLGPHVDRPERLQELAGNESIVERAQVTEDGWWQRRRFAEWAAFERYRRFWTSNAERFALRRLVDAERARSVEDGLTDRQREALAAAYEMGYFEVPRGASLGEVAATLDISASSLSERLRRAQTCLVESALEDAGPDGRRLKRPHR